MNSFEALKAVSEEFEHSISIREMPGNPNFLGWYLFSVDGKLCFVTQQKEVLIKEDGNTEVSHPK